MKGVYCYLFIHQLLYTINLFGIPRTGDGLKEKYENNMH